MIWTNSQLEQWAEDAIGQITVDVNSVWAREAIPTQAGVSVLRLPNYVRKLRRVVWRGRTLDPQSWEELTLLTPATVFLEPGSSANRESSIGRPLFYALHPTNIYDVRVYPTPNETFTAAGEPNVYAPTPNSPSCIIDYWRVPDTSAAATPQAKLPTYIERRTVKAYVMWKAFAAEGKGQDMNASAYYQKKYEFLIAQFKMINEGCFVSKKYCLGDGMLDPQQFRYPKPTLNPNFERVIF